VIIPLPSVNDHTLTCPRPKDRAVETLLALVARSLAFTQEIQGSALPMLLFAVVGAILAAYGGWHVTDRLISWRQRPEED
jgi:hypothetical protein